MDRNRGKLLMDSPQSVLVFFLHSHVSLSAFITQQLTFILIQKKIVKQRDKAIK